MTLEDIKKALECCSSDSKKSCKKCPYVTVKGFCYNKLEKDVLDLINRQQDDIKTLKKDKYKLQKALNQSEDYRVIAKAEAIKEFADRLKADCPDKLLVIHFDAIDNLVKEMVGEENDT